MGICSRVRTFFRGAPQTKTTTHSLKDLSATLESIEASKPLSPPKITQNDWDALVLSKFAHIQARINCQNQLDKLTHPGSSGYQAYLAGQCMLAEYDGAFSEYREFAEVRKDFCRFVCRTKSLLENELNRLSYCIQQITAQLATSVICPPQEEIISLAC
jgi:hypothetical protein